MDQPKRPHRKTGHKPPGGARPGAGRPPGSGNALPMGAVSALVATKCADGRLGKDGDPGKRAVVEAAYQAVAEVLADAGNPFTMGHRLKAAAMVADAVAGKEPEKVEVSGVSISINGVKK